MPIAQALELPGATNVTFCPEDSRYAAVVFEYPAVRSPAYSRFKLDTVCPCKRGWLIELCAENPFFI